MRRKDRRRNNSPVLFAIITAERDGYFEVATVISAPMLSEHLTALANQPTESEGRVSVPVDSVWKSGGCSCADCFIRNHAERRLSVRQALDSPVPIPLSVFSDRGNSVTVHGTPIPGTPVSGVSVYYAVTVHE